MVTCEKSVLFDGHVWLLAKKAYYLMDMCGYLRTKSAFLEGRVWLRKNKAPG